MLTRLALPAPSADELAHSARVVARVREALAEAGGWLPFARYMDLVLYAPGLGYYAAGAHKLGAGGDFTTAPELSPVFGRCVATQVGAVLDALGEGAELLELGAGTGRLACDVLGELARRGRAPPRYRILEVSADLRARQRELFAVEQPALAARVEWLDAPPREPWRGVLLANEVLDALPCERFRRTATGVEALGVVDGARGFEWAARPASAELAGAVAAIEAELPAPLAPGYESECVPLLAPWLATVTGALAQGAALCIDYGAARRELYAPARAHGTLACHYRQRRIDDPFLNPGLQDLTAWVDFTAVAHAALACGLEVAGYTTQAHFLLGTGFDVHAAAVRDAAGTDGPLRVAAAARLVLPGEFGERYKCIALARDCALPLAGFALRDFTATL